MKLRNVNYLNTCSDLILFYSAKKVSKNAVAPILKFILHLLR